MKAHDIKAYMEYYANYTILSNNLDLIFEDEK
jgi:hypothetical protein